MKSYTFGTLPSKEEFIAAFEKHYPEGYFAFAHDKRVGTVSFSANELLKEVMKARSEWETGKAIRNGIHSTLTEEGILNAGSWASKVLNCLGIEWI